MFRRFKRGEIALGAMMMEHGPEWLEILGYVGMDFGAIDMMNASIDWSDAAEMVRACARYELTPRIRLQSYPWGGDRVDPRLQADVYRAIGIGAEVIVASVNTAEAVEAMMAPAYERYGDHLPAGMSSTRPWIVPDLESLPALDNIEHILQVEGLKAITLSLADISQAIGHPFDYRHPELMSIVKTSASKAAKRDVAVFAFAGGSTPDEVAESIELLWLAGVQGFTVPRLTVAAQRFYERLLRQVDGDNPKARGLAAIPT
jgi:2-keto-3-deoxy-L-rhamnonate aldolase RhmA